MHKVGARGFEPLSAGFHCRGSYPPRNLSSHRSSYSSTVSKPNSNHAL